MADKQTLANFVDGAFVPPAEGGNTDVVNPATGEVYAAAPLSTRRRRRRRVRGRRARVRGVAATRRRRAAGGAAGDGRRDRGSTASELVAAEAENTGKPIGLTTSEEIPPMVDQIRFFAGAARVLEGKAGAASTCAGSRPDPAGAGRRDRVGWRRGTTR